MIKIKIKITKIQKGTNKNNKKNDSEQGNKCESNNRNEDKYNRNHIMNNNNTSNYKYNCCKKWHH